MTEMNADELLDALGVEVAPLKASSRTPREERIIAGFEDILRFHQAHGRAPLHGEDRDDIETGTIYVLRSQSSHPFVAEHRELIHKIGVTGGKVEARIAGAEKDATYLLAKVEVVATYKLHNLNRIRLENIFHRLFGAAQLDLTIEDRFGNPVKPREWFLVPLHVIDEAVQRIRDGSITDAVYDPKSARLIGQGPH
jgi:hypothetical protein